MQLFKKGLREGEQDPQLWGTFWEHLNCYWEPVVGGWHPYVQAKMYPHSLPLPKTAHWVWWHIPIPCETGNEIPLTDHFSNAALVKGGNYAITFKTTYFIPSNCPYLPGEISVYWDQPLFQFCPDFCWSTVSMSCDFFLSRISRSKYLSKRVGTCCV